MENESLHVKYLIVIAAVLCAVIIGYNAFYVPDTDMTALTASADAAKPLATASDVGPLVSFASEGEYVPMPARQSDASAPSPVSSAAVSVSSRLAGTEAAPQKQGGKVDLNTATAEQLETLDGIGEALAGRILAYRREHGKFSSVDEIKNVSGIGDKKYEAIRGFVTVG